MKELAQLESFLAYRDETGLSNREKIDRYRKVIRRTAATDRNRSYEETSAADDLSRYGIVMEDDRLTGFSIHIFNEDIYPLQSFEIYFRNCGLSGKLDLEGQGELLFVDIYQNNVEAVNVSGDKELRILGIQDNRISELDVSDLAAVLGIDAGMNRLQSIDVRWNTELTELYINDNRIREIHLENNPKLKYFYCHNNQIETLDTRRNPLLRHLNATGNPLRSIRAMAPQREEPLPLALTAEGPGFVGLKFNPVYNAQWKETGEWQQCYFAYPQEGHAFEGWYDEDGTFLSKEPVWEGTYGESRVMEARFL